MARRYRCLNCHTDFVAEQPVCAKCGIDPATDPRAAGIIQPLATIHYDPPHPRIKFRGMGHRACDPTKPIGTGRGTGEPRVVNCEACKATVAFQEAVARGALEGGFLESDDEVIEPAHLLGATALAGGGPVAGVVIEGKGGCGCGKGG